MREFDSGANRDSEEGKLDYEACMSPIVIRRYAQYLNEHNTQKDGERRAEDNWQKGMPKGVYIKSLFRHFMDLWLHHRHYPNKARHSAESALCAIIFNASGYLYEILRKEQGEIKEYEELVREQQK